MDFRGDERGQPVLIGAILLFAMLVLAFATYQGVVVPSQNAEVEYNHFQVVEGQFSELRTSATNAIGSGEQRSVTISLGTRYPPRLIALNPSAPSGSLETTGEGEVLIEGLDYAAADLCATNANETTSRSLLYTPSYHEHRSAESITFENTFRARSFRDGQTQFDGQRLVQPGNGDEATKINLMILTGSFSRSSGDSFDLDLNPTHRYSVDVNPDDEFNVTVPSRFSAAQWEDQVLADTNITSVEQDDGQVKIRFPEGDYRISCAALGLNSQPAYQPPGGDSDDRTFDTRWNEEETATARPSRGSLSLSMIATNRESGGAISNASVDFAYSSDGSNAGEIVIEGSKTGETNETGENTTTINISNSVDGDIYEIYTTAGDDSDKVSLNIQEPRFTSVHVDNISAGNSVSQTFSIGLNEAVKSGDEVEIVLDEAHGPNAVQYPTDESNISTTGGGSTSIDASGQGQSYSIIYTVAETDAGTEFEVIVDDIDSSSGEGTYDVFFDLHSESGTDLDSDEDSFTVTAS